MVLSDLRSLEITWSRSLASFPQDSDSRLAKGCCKILILQIRSVKSVNIEGTLAGCCFELPALMWELAKFRSVPVVHGSPGRVDQYMRTVQHELDRIPRF